MAKLHIGCGERRLPGYLSIDIRPGVRPDIVGDVTALPVRQGSCSLIYACMVLEHIPDEAILQSLSQWRVCLGRGGVLRLSLPDFAASCRYYTYAGGDIRSLDGLLLGRKDYAENGHFTLWDWKRAEGALFKAGFSKVRWWDWRKELPEDYDDFASAYLPDFCKETGMHMALNIEGVK